MWQLLTPSRKRVEGRHTPARRPRRHRPHCKPLEDRCLLSVSLTDPAAGCPLRRIAGHLDGDVQRPRDNARLPVQRRAARRSSPGRSGLQPQRQLHLEPHAAGDLRHPGGRQGRIQRLERRVRERDVYGADAGRGDSAVVSPMANPLVALYSAPPSPGTSMYVQFAQLGPNPSWQNTSPLPIVPGESTNFIVAGMLPNTTYLMRDVLDDGTVSAPLAFTTGSLPTNLNFPTFTVVQPPAAGTDLSQDMIFHAGVNRDPDQHRQHPGDRPERQRRSGTMTRWPTTSPAMPRTSCRAAR